jgi:hypothetical protein
VFDLLSNSWNDHIVRNQIPSEVNGSQSEKLGNGIHNFVFIDQATSIYAQSEFAECILVLNQQLADKVNIFFTSDTDIECNKLMKLEKTHGKNPKVFEAEIVNREL